MERRRSRRGARPPRRGSAGTAPVFFTLICALAAALGACSTGLTEQARLDRAAAHMNHREYGEAVEILEDSLARERDPDAAREIAWMLAHAHLGKGGFELFRLASDVIGSQGEARPFELAVREPRCAPEAIEELKGYDLRCLTLRLIRHLPDAEQVHFRRARDLFRQYFPDESETPVDVNFLSALVEVGSSLSRMRALLAREAVLVPTETLQQEDERFGRGVRNLKRFFEEIVRGFKRASWSYQKVSDFVVTLDGRPIVRAGRASLVFNERLGFPEILRFAAEVLHQEARAVDRELNRAAEGYLGALPTGIVRVAELMDREHLGSATAGALRAVWNFERVLGRLLSSAAGQIGSGRRFSLFEAMWNHPPAIAQGLSEAIREAWRTESPQPLRDFREATDAEWAELEEITEGWSAWFGAALSGEQVRAIERHLTGLIRANPRLLKPPSSLAGAEARDWLVEVTALLRDGLRQVLDGGLAGELALPPEFREGQEREGRRLLDATAAWIGRNLWEVR